MTDLASLPPSVLLKVATLEQACIGLTTTLEASRRELQRLRVERRDCIPEAQPDQYAANRESERVLANWARLDAAIEAQQAHCERQEQRLRTEESVVRACKQYLHGLPSDARLRVVEGRAGDLAGIRERIRQTKDEIARVKATPVPSPDLPERIKAYVAKLSVRPAVTGIRRPDIERGVSAAGRPAQHAGQCASDAGISRRRASG
jgi:hypothetical protein